MIRIIATIYLFHACILYLTHSTDSSLKDVIDIVSDDDTEEKTQSTSPKTQSKSNFSRAKRRPSSDKRRGFKFISKRKKRSGYTSASSQGSIRKRRSGYTSATSTTSRRDNNTNTNTSRRINTNVSRIKSPVFTKDDLRCQNIQGMEKKQRKAIHKVCIYIKFSLFTLNVTWIFKFNAFTFIQYIEEN